MSAEPRFSRIVRAAAEASGREAGMPAGASRAFARNVAERFRSIIARRPSERTDAVILSFAPEGPGLVATLAMPGRARSAVCRWLGRVGARGRKAETGRAPARRGGRAV
jgi:hypothetical protein